MSKLLVSFINPVAVMVDDRSYTCHHVVCEEIGQSAVSIEEKPEQLADAATPAAKSKMTRKELRREMRRAIHAPLDFPLYLRVLSFGDGKPFGKTYPMIVKYNNISAIMELTESK